MKKALILTVLLMAPAALVALVLYSIPTAGTIEKAPPVGAGAGETGGANAIGEYLAHGMTRTVEERVGLVEAREAHAEELARTELEEVQPQAGLVAPETLPQGFMIVVEDRAKVSGKERPIFIASNHYGWNAADPRQILDGRSDLRWQIEFEQPEAPARMEFKFTLGSWSTVEVDENGEQIANRTLPMVDPALYADGSRPIFEFVVPQWDVPEDPSDAILKPDRYRVLDVTGDVRRLEVAGGAGPASHVTRDLLVWLPPGYDDNPSRTYPVLYMMDGQNLYEQLPGVPGEWRVDETLTDLIGRGAVEPVVVVGIPHSDQHRANEYLPVDMGHGWEPHGEAYLDWLTSEVKPRVESAFRVRTDRAGVGIGGSSLGAVIAMHAALTRPDEFGLVLAESLSGVAFDPNPWTRAVGSASVWPIRIYMGMGEKEAGNDAEQNDLNAKYVEGIRAVDRVLASRGMADEARLLVPSAPGHNHNEDAWAERFPFAIQFLFPAP